MDPVSNDGRWRCCAQGIPYDGYENSGYDPKCEKGEATSKDTDEERSRAQQKQDTWIGGLIEENKDQAKEIKSLKGEVRTALNIEG